MRVAGIQLDTAWEDPQRSFERARPWIGAAAAAGAELVVLPEMYACGFSMATARIAEAVDGPSTAFLRE
ncbi:MAG: carbon-nitrogen family hydrolase, partial [Deltaproteobacteria bacterium]|nr:carbon-nitrogen family hydrolase [Nannocystaceae bacterium]